MINFKLIESDMSRKAIIVPPYPIIEYRWEELIELKKWMLYFFLFTTLIFVAILIYAAYLALLVFIKAPEHPIRIGTYGLIPGLVFLFSMYKVIPNITKLLYFLVKSRK
jgi:hypothetical protein